MALNERTEYHAQLINARTGKTIDDDTGKFIVLTAGEAQPAPNLYSDKNGTAITYTAATSANTITNGEIKFFTLATVTSVDLTIVTASGHSIFVEGFTPSQHKIEVCLEEIRQVLIAPYYATVQSLTSTASVWANGLSIPAKSMVHDVFMRTTVLGTASTMNIGVSGTPTGLVDAFTAAVTGFHVDEPLTVSVTSTFGLGSLLLGANATNTSFRRSYGVSTATAIVWFDSTQAVTGPAAGYVYITYDIFQTA